MTPLTPEDPPAVGPYRLQGRLGSGGMGTVYLAHGPDGRTVALKLIRPELALAPEFRSRFAGEVANARRVADFCTARVLDHGVLGGRPYLVTEFVEGPCLADAIESGGPLESGSLHGLATGIATALTAIHAVNLVHRDLKPGNVLLSATGPRIIDFGIARALDAPNHHTQTGLVVGSAGWIAPEQVFDGTVTPAADIFTWGSLVAFAATGHHPYGTGNLMVLAARAHRGEHDLLGLGDEPLRSLVTRALSPDPARRPTAPDLLVALAGDADPRTAAHLVTEQWMAGAQTRSWVASGPPRTLPAAPAPVTRPRARNARLGPVLAVVSVLAVAAVGTAVLIAQASQGGSASPPPEPAGLHFRRMPAACEAISKKTFAKLAPHSSPKTNGSASSFCQAAGSYRLPSDKPDNVEAETGYKNDPHERSLYLYFIQPNYGDPESSPVSSVIKTMREQRTAVRNGPGDNSAPAHMDPGSYADLPGIGDEAYSYTYKDTDALGSSAHVVARLGNAILEVDYTGSDRKHGNIDTDTQIPVKQELKDAQAVAREALQNLRACSTCLQ